MARRCTSSAEFINGHATPLSLISFCGLMFCLGDDMSIGVTAARAVVLIVFMREPI